MLQETDWGEGVTGATGRRGGVSRGSGCELLFGNGAVKDALDG